MSTPSSETRSRVSRSLTASGSEPQIWSRAPVRRWISGQARSSTCSPLRVSWRPGEGDRVLAAARDRRPRGSARRSGRSRTRPEASGRPSRAPARRRRSAGRSGSRESPRPASPASSSRGRRRHGAWRRSAQVAIASTEMQVTGVIGSCRCSTSKRSRSSTRLIRKIARGLRMMFGSDPFAGTITERPIGITFARRVAVAADPRVQGARELTGWVVAHHQPHLVPARLERLRLQLGMLDDRAPERPRERHHDADLHAGSLFTRRSRRGRRAPRRRRACAARRRRMVEEPCATPARWVGRASEPRRARVGELGVEPAPVVLAARRARPSRRARAGRRGASAHSG